MRGATPAATARQVGNQLPAMRRLRRDLPAELCEAVDAALDPDPFYRPAPSELREALSATEALLSDEGGLVEPETLERFGLTAVRARSRLRTLVLGAPAVDAGDEAEVPAGHLARALPRAASGLATGGLLLVALETLAPTPAVSPLALAAASALLVALLPRVGWLLTALGLCGYLTLPDTDRAGTALVLAAALAPVPLLLPRAGTLWSVPALAPLLGTVALAPLFVGVAALPRSPWRRAGLGVAGFLWLAVAEVLTGEQLLFGVADGTAPRSAWEDSPIDAAADALAPDGHLARPGAGGGVGGFCARAAVLRARTVGGGGRRGGRRVGHRPGGRARDAGRPAGRHGRARAGPRSGGGRRPRGARGDNRDPHRPAGGPRLARARITLSQR